MLINFYLIFQEMIFIILFLLGFKLKKKTNDVGVMYQFLVLNAQ